MPLDLTCRMDLGRNDILYYEEQAIACHPCRKRWLILVFSHTMRQSGDGVFIIILIRGGSLAACFIPRNMTYTLFFLAHFVSSGCDPERSSTRERRYGRVRNRREPHAVYEDSLPPWSPSVRRTSRLSRTPKFCIATNTAQGRILAQSCHVVWGHCFSWRVETEILKKYPCQAYRSKTFVTARVTCL